MEHTLRCNSLECRRELKDHAVVTTCSHIFCVDCSNREQLSGRADGQRPICPACDMHLMNPDDVVITNLNPTEDYKTSVLSGLSPNVIMECGGRALSFWAYQTTQEIVYQAHMSKKLTNKCTTLSTHMDRVIHDANAEVTTLRTQLSNMAAEQDAIKRKHHELLQAYREKQRQAQQAQEMYDRSKRKDMLDQMEHAASDAADNTVEESLRANRYGAGNNDQSQVPMQPPRFQAQQPRAMQHPSLAATALNSRMVSPVRRPINEQSNWAGFSSQGTQNNSQNAPVETPSTHRQRLVTTNINPTPRVGLPNISMHSTTPVHRNNATCRSPLANINGNIGFAGYGMSAGLKVSNPNDVGSTVLPRPVGRSRGLSSSSKFTP
ncbi:cyclin B1 interacting protein-like protein 1 [Calycina marina]|uniref:Cyclin B1 interacting protein-like protein 1 n=1 Tax=Calycina marina TaxID=1763456 RepID=A0A9P7Z538_9HELO|nr:cyclin B1 interacting protein-like protein 1 [Calycina marina]